MLPAAESREDVLTFGKSRRVSDLRNCDFQIASNIVHVHDAWHVLYDAYHRAGYIRSNPYRLHTTHHAVGHHALVLLGRSNGHVVSTISAIGDSERGLPLDKVYPFELEAMRCRGGKLLEIGLFGDRRDIRTSADRSFTSVFELMRYTFYFGVHTGVTDFLCGIPPRRAPLYTRCFGFRAVGETKSYGAVEDNPVVLMHATTDDLLRNARRYRAIQSFVQRPIDREAFDQRFSFAAPDVEGTALASYLRWQNRRSDPAIVGAA